MNKLSSKIKILYLALIFIFYLSYYFYKPKPKLSDMSLKNKTSILRSGVSFNGLIDFNTNENRVNIGKNYYFRDKKHWYFINQLSFWRNEYLNLELINKLSKKSDFKIKILDNNNYAQVSYKGEKIVYACIQKTGDFYYQFNYGKIINTKDFYYWKQKFIENIMFVFNYFKPRNSQCLLVITSNIDFFELGDNKKKEMLLDKFTY